MGDGSDPWVLAQADLDRAVGLVAGTDNDTTNLSLVAAARRSNPRLFLAARQNRAASAPLFAAMEVDALLVPTRGDRARGVRAAVHAAAVAVPAGDAGDGRRVGGEELVDRLTELCGTHLQALWKVRLTPQEAPALGPWLASGEARLGQLLRNPEDRDEPLHAIVADRPPRPGGDPRAGRRLRPASRATSCCSSAGRPPAARSTRSSSCDGVLEYVVTGRRVPSSWIWRRLSRSDSGETGGPRTPDATSAGRA